MSNQGIVPKRYLNRHETAEYLGCTYRWFFRSVEARQIPYTIVAGKAMYDVHVLDEWVASQQTTMGRAGA